MAEGWALARRAGGRRRGSERGLVGGQLSWKVERKAKAGPTSGSAGPTARLDVAQAELWCAHGGQGRSAGVRKSQGVGMQGC